MHSCFLNRVDAGRQLAAKLTEYARRADVAILALPRGGVIVAKQVAQILQVPLDVFIVRKLGVPGNEELAMGAIASGGVRILNSEIIHALQISESVLDAVTSREETEVKRREQMYLAAGVPRVTVAEHTILLIDDGIATGSTIRAAVSALRSRHPKQIIVGTPIVDQSTADRLRENVEQIVAVVSSHEMSSVGDWYEDFRQITDTEVCECLTNARLECSLN